jgi:hypothetical protein
MRALSFPQPQATLVVCGLKQLDPRCWYTGYRGRVAIYARDEYPKGAALNLCEMPTVRRALYVRGCRNLGQVPRGAVIGTVTLVDCIKVERLTPILLTKTELLWGDYKPGQWVFVFRDAVRFTEPLPAAGRTGLWEWPEPVGACV